MEKYLSTAIAVTVMNGATIANDHMELNESVPMCPNGQSGKKAVYVNRKNGTLRLMIMSVMDKLTNKTLTLSSA